MSDVAQNITKSGTLCDANTQQMKLQQQRMQLLLMPPSSGSFPLSLSIDDVKKLGVTLLYVGLGAVVTYLLQTVIPGIHTDNAVVLLVLPIVTGVLQTLERYFRDTRPAEEQKVLPYRLYKERIRALAMQEAAGVKIDPDHPKT